MLNVNLDLSDELQQFVASEAQGGRFNSPAAYIEALIARAREGKNRLESLLIEGLDSGEPIPLDDQEWSRIRGEVHRRLANG